MHHRKGNLSIVVAKNGTTSQAIDMRGKVMASIYVPTIDSATVKIQGSPDGSTWADVKSEDLTVIGSWDASTGGFIPTADVIAQFVGINYLRIVLGAAQTTAARTFLVTVY